VPCDVVGGCSEGLSCFGTEAVDREGDRVEAGQDSRETWTPGVVPVLVPPAIFEKVQAILDLPVATDIAQQIVRGDRLGIEAGDEVAHVVRNHFAVWPAQLTIDAQRDAAARQLQRFTNVVGVV